MKKKEFLEELNKILSERNYKDKEEVIKDFEEHFRIGEQEGKSEEEISKLLGNPKDIADQFKEDEDVENKNTIISEEENKNSILNKSGNTVFTKFVLSTILIFFNIVFVFGLVAGIFGGLIGLFAGTIAVAVSGIAVFVVGILGLIIGTTFIASNIISLILLFTGIGLVCLGILGVIFVGWLSVQTVKLLIKYGSWNLKVIQGGI